MTVIKADVPLQQNVRQMYGDAVDALPPDAKYSIIIHKDHRANVLNYIKRKYGTTRTYTTQTDKSSIIRLYRLK